MNDDNGGSAFPIPLDDRPGAYPAEPGMSLRDYFAAKALAAMLANTNKVGAKCGKTGLLFFPGYAYEWADATRCTDCMVGQGRTCHCIEPMRSSDVWILFAIVVVDLVAVIGVVWLAWRALA